jgi:hypothetical protein
MLKKIIYGALIILFVVQFIRPTKNNSNDNTHHISTKYRVPAEVDTILKVACYDCHSNNTAYPWYSNLQPAAWFLSNHVKDGKKHLNFSEFTKLSIAIQNHKLEEIIEEVEEKEMPLASYTYVGLHANAKLNDEQRLTLNTWAREQINYLKATYPADSLKMKKRKKNKSAKK